MTKKTGFDKYVEERMKDPEFAKAYKEAEKEMSEPIKKENYWVDVTLTVKAEGKEEAWEIIERLFSSDVVVKKMIGLEIDVDELYINEPVREE